MSARQEFDLTFARAFVQGQTEASNMNGPITDFLINSNTAYFIGPEAARDITPDFQNIVTGSHLKALQPYTSFFERITLEPGLAELNYAFEKARELGLKPQDIRSEGDLPLPTRLLIQSNSNDPTTPYLEAVLADSNLRNQWIQEVKEQTQISNDKLVRQIRKEAKKGIYMRFPWITIGGGATTPANVAVGNLVTNPLLITADDFAGQKWWNRRNIFLNSSNEVDGAEGVLDFPLPLLRGSTTPAGSLGRLNLISPIAQNDSSDLVVSCNVGTKRYETGPKLGARITTNTILSVPNVLKNRDVDFTSAVQLVDGILVNTYDKAGNNLPMIGDNLFALTGTGEEDCKIPRIEAKRIYTESQRIVQNQLESQIVTKPVLPRVITQTSAELLFALWEKSGFKSEYWPFWDAFNPEANNAILGGKDSSDIHLHFQLGLAPPSAYPENFDPRILPKSITIFGGDVSNLDEYFQTKRKRYAEPLKKLVTRRPEIANRLQFVPYKAQDIIRTPNGSAILTTGFSADISYIFSGTGFTRRPIEKEVPFELKIAYDAFGFATGLEDATGRFYVGGAAAGLPLEKRNMNVQGIAKFLGIPENTIALWGTEPEVERRAWQIASRMPFDRKRYQNLMKLSQKMAQHPIPEVREWF